MATTRPISKIEAQIRRLEEKASTLDSIVEVCKTAGGRINDNGKNLIYIFREAGMKKSQIARILDVTPAALTPYE